LILLVLLAFSVPVAAVMGVLGLAFNQLPLTAALLFVQGISELLKSVRRR
jgi:hypothetical protein